MNSLNEVINNLDKFPTTRYQGSKRRLVPWLYDVFKQIEFDSVFDGFGGTASASYLFKLMGKQVTFNDILKSNFQTGLALIENDSIKLIDTDIDHLLSKRNSKIPSFIYDTFNDIYYYDEENQWLDQIVFNINNLSEIYTGDILCKKKALAFHALFQACLSKRPFNLFHRKNLYIRVADVPRTFSNKKTWDIEFDLLFRKFATEISSKIFSNGHTNTANCSDIIFHENYDYDLVYLDPPYQRPSESHPKDYYLLYHFLEGLVDYDKWPSRIDFSKKHRPLLNIPSQFNAMKPLERFSFIFDKFNKSVIAISYGDPGKPTINEIVETLNKFKKNVNVLDIEYSYKLNRRNGTNLREVLIIGF